MTSHDYARELKRVADCLERREEFDLPDYLDEVALKLSYFDDKKRFLAAVRALGTGTKGPDKYITNDYIFTPAFGGLRIQAERNTVCRLVRPAEYECEPLLSPEEEQAVGK